MALPPSTYNTVKPQLLLQTKLLTSNICRNTLELQREVLNTVTVISELTYFGINELSLRKENLAIDLRS
jgi:hypothetical protein